MPLPLLGPDHHFRLRMKREIEPFLALAISGNALELMRISNPAAVAEVFAKAREHPTRLYARPAADHAKGRRDLMAFSSERLSHGLELAEQLARQRTGLSWPEQVLPFGLAGFAPRNWTLTEASRDVHLPA